MTKIKKSIWSAVVGLVMALTLVFGVVAGVKTNEMANADDVSYKDTFYFIVFGYFETEEFDEGYTSSIITNNTPYTIKLSNNSDDLEAPEVSMTQLEAYEYAWELYNTKLTDADKRKASVVASHGILCDIKEQIFDPADAVIKLINEDLGVYISDSEYYVEPEKVYYRAASFGYTVYDENHLATGYVYSTANLDTAITYSEKDLVAEVETAYDALDENQQTYVSWYTRDLYNKKAAKSALTEMEGYLTAVINGSLELYPNVAAGVYYSYKGAYETIVANYNKLDPAAQAGTEITNSLYPDLDGLDQVFVNIENAANAAKTAIADLEYYSFDAKELVKVDLDKEIVYDQEYIFNFNVEESNYRIVVDTKPSFETATAALDAIYNGRTVNGFTVANCKVANLSATERTALATYLAELVRYDKVASTFTLYQQYADETSAKIDDVNVTGENHYKVPAVENAIGEVYADYEALYDGSCMDADGEYSFNNVQKLISEENQAKIEGYKDTLDTLNAWIARVALLVKANNQQENLPNTVDGVIEWAWNKIQAEEPFGFDVDDKEEVEALLHGLEATEEHDAYNGYDQLVASEAEAEEQPKTNALQKPHDVLVYIEGLIDEAIAEEEARVERLEELLVEMKNVLTNGVKYADRVLVDEFDRLMSQISRTSQAGVRNSENYKYYVALNEALDVILTRVTGSDTVEGVTKALDDIKYRFEIDGSYVFGREDEYEAITFDNDGKVVNVVADSRPSIEHAQELVENVYNGAELVASNQVEYKLATLSYAEWATEDVVAVGEENVNAFVYYFGQFVEIEDYYAKYEGSVAKLEELKTLASELQADIEAFYNGLTVENHYRTAENQETIVSLYNRYCAFADYLDNEEVRGAYDDLRPWVTRVELVNDEPVEVNGGDIITDAHETLEELNGWVEDVATAIDADTTEAEGADYVIENTQPEDVNLSLDEIEELLETYDEITNEDPIKEAAVYDAYKLLNDRKDQIEQEAEELQEELDGLTALLVEGVKYSDKVTYDDLKERADALEELGAELDTTNLETLKEALDDIERTVASNPTHAGGLQYALTNIEYRHGTEEQGYDLTKVAENGQIVADSRASVEAAQAAVEAVYNGREVYVETEEGQVLLYRIANLSYAEWATEDVVAVGEENVNAFVYYEFLTAEDYANYEAAVEALEALKTLARELQNDIEEQFINVLSVDNHYRTLKTTIVELYERYCALADYLDGEKVRGAYDDLRPWVTRVVLDEETGEEVETIYGGRTIAEANRVLEDLVGWRDAVATAIDADTAETEGTDYVIEEATAERIPVELTLAEINGLVLNYNAVTGNDPIKEAAVADAYALLKAREDEINGDAEDLKDKIAELDAENVTYKAKPTYVELAEELERLQDLGVTFTPDETANLDALGAAIEAIEERAQELKDAMDSMLYYVEPEEATDEDTCMVNDRNGAVVYDTRASLLVAKAAIEAIYPANGQDNVAKLGATWYEDETEVAAFLAEYAEFAGITADDVAEYVRVLTEYKALEDAAKAVAERINALTLTAENHFKAQEADINQLLLDFAALMHNEVLHNHNNWYANPVVVDVIHYEATDEEPAHDEPVYELVLAKDLEDEVIFPNEYTEKLFFVAMTLSSINRFDCQVANFANGEEVADSDSPLDEEQIATIDAILAEHAERDLSEVYTYDVRTLQELVDEYESHVTLFGGEGNTFNLFPTVEVADYKEAYVASLQLAKDVLDNYYDSARTLNNKLVEIIVDICEKNDPEFPDKTLSEDDEDMINYVEGVYEQLTWSQKAILENDFENHYEPFYDDEGEECGGFYWNQEILDRFHEELGWDTIAPRTIDEFFNVADRFEGANYYKQAVAELATQLEETYFTVEGYVLEKGLLAMYFTFDDEMKAMVESAYQKLLNIDAAYKEVNRDDYTSYTSVTENLAGQIEDAKTELADAQAALEADIIEALGVEGAETVKEALAAYKAAVAQAQEDLGAAQDALVASITNSLDEDAESVEKAFETYKGKVAEAQEKLETAQEALVNEIKTALGEEEAESVQAALENYKSNVETVQEENSKAAEDGNKENDEKVAKLKKALIITAVVGGVVTIAAAACIIALFAKMSALGGAAASSSAAGSTAAKGGKEE